MSGDYEHIRALLLDAERLRLDQIDAALRRADERLKDISETLAESIERANAEHSASRLARALSESTAGSLELAVRRRPGAVVQAVFPIIGPAIRRALGAALRGMASDLDQALYDAFSLRSLRWRLESWRTGTPYAYVALRHRLQYSVDHLFLIQAESGLLLDHASALEVADIDVDAVAGMLTAIQQFVQDSMSMGGEGGLDGATVGEYRLLVSHGPLARVAAFVRGVPPSEMSDRLDELIELIHARNGQVLEDSRGMAQGGFLDPHVLDDLNQLRQEGAAAQRRRPNRWLALAGSGLLAVAIVWGLLAYQWSREARIIGEEVAAIPGVVPIAVESEGRNALQIHALQDLAAEDPRARVAKLHPHVHVTWRLQPFLSSDPIVIARRVRQQLALPEGVAVRVDSDGSVSLEGVVPFARWHAIHAPVFIPGVNRLVTNRLEYPDRARIEALKHRIEAQRIDYAEGTAPAATATVQLADLMADLEMLSGHARRGAIRLRVRTFGYTDEPGSPALNRELRLRRAERLADDIRIKLTDITDIDVSMNTLSAGRFHGKHRAAGIGIELIPGQE